MEILILKHNFKKSKSKYISLEKGIILNYAVILYVIVGYFLSWIALSLSSIEINLLGVLLLTHNLIVSAYLSHEFMHGLIFDSMRWNIIGGHLMLWINGSCYFRFRDLANTHITHHINNVDSVDFDLSSFLEHSSKWLRYSILILEWLYFPAVNIFLRFREIFAPFMRSELRGERSRILIILLTRVTCFLVIGIHSPKALLLYLVSYISTINILRFMDAFQHTYEFLPTGLKLHKHNASYEQEHTFSVQFPERLSWISFLFLNFGYHNAHHASMTCPWYRLHQLHKQFYYDSNFNCIRVLELVKNYHQFRVKRLLLGQGDVISSKNELDINHFYGATCVSFLMKA